jgi:hypothetical protein
MSHPHTRVNGSRTLIVLRCDGTPGQRCRGSLTLEATKFRSRNQAGAARATPKVAFDLAPGETENVRVQLPSTSRTQLVKRRKAVIRAVATFDDGTTLKRLMTVYPQRGTSG